MSAPRSDTPLSARWLILGALVLTTLVSVRFLIIGAWPVMIFALLDIGALALAMHLFARSPVPEEWLTARPSGIELVQSDARGRVAMVRLPAGWTRLEADDRAETQVELALVAQGRRYPFGACLTAAERRAIIPHVEALLARSHRP